MFLRIKPRFTEEQQAEHKRIGREYQQQMMKRRNKTDKDLATKIWLQQEAIRALPEDLRAQAVIIDETPPPSDRPWPVYATPPIKGFDPRKYMKGGGDTSGEPLVRME